MTENSKIEWTHHTFNPWVGCTKVSPGCDHCYAESWAKRTGNPQLWSTGQRRRTTAANWREPVKWNARCALAGIRERVFCASLADVFDNVVPDVWRADLFKLITQCNHLDWLLLTKRIGNVKPMLRAQGLALPDNVWLGATVVNQDEYDRDLPKLLYAQARMRFLSMEPLLGPVDLRMGGMSMPDYAPHRPLPRLDWIIVGGESGGGARSLEIGWVSRIIEQCAGAGVPCFVKQLGARPLMAGVPWEVDSTKGGDMSEWPSALRVREFPC